MRITPAQKGDPLPGFLLGIRPENGLSVCLRIHDGRSEHSPSDKSIRLISVVNAFSVVEYEVRILCPSVAHLDTTNTRSSRRQLCFKRENPSFDAAFKLQSRRR